MKEHYNKGSIEGFKIIETIVCNYDGHSAFLVGNILKYLIRAPFKNSFATDLLKMNDYANELVEYLGLRKE